MPVAVTVLLTLLSLTCPAQNIINLTDQNNESFQFSQLHGKVVLLFFGFTYCPDVCPAELSKIASVLRSFEDNKNQVQGVFVSVDPQRDTPEKIKSYVEYFGSNLIGLTGTSEQINQISKQYHVKYKIKKTSDSGQNYSVDHSANIYILDDKGELISIVPYGFPASHVKAVIDELLRVQN